ncbi:hypothetical protein GYMLUDRAFT_244518 [Collybiopsis luxurians FD-317 M1]|uniref:Uncharacterized protein n=1 Tax=Collybiopsis luxurians FD-317 M1 TaxID=944289 RepID=A0A0D0CDI5_9AGAR|nr:hypothetical protein GYMLUDRAFT_244518 [Collybiopsis luxurians FD-317 M1]
MSLHLAKQIDYIPEIPTKCKQNITGLKNQKRPTLEAPSDAPAAPSDSGCATSQLKTTQWPKQQSAGENEEVADGCWIQEDMTLFAQRFGYREEAKNEDEEEECEVDGWEEEWFNSKELEEKLFHYAAAMDSDVEDGD